jgi:hypothetical protein
MIYVPGSSGEMPNSSDPIAGDGRDEYESESE